MFVFGVRGWFLEALFYPLEWLKEDKSALQGVRERKEGNAQRKTRFISRTVTRVITLLTHLPLPHFCILSKEVTTSYLRTFILGFHSPQECRSQGALDCFIGTVIPRCLLASTTVSHVGDVLSPGSPDEYTHQNTCGLTCLLYQEGAQLPPSPAGVLRTRTGVIHLSNSHLIFTSYEHL